MEALADAVIYDFIKKHNGWEYVDNSLVKKFQFSTYLSTVSFVNMVAFLAEKHNHHPSIQLDYGQARLSWNTHDVGHKVSDKDLKIIEELQSFLAS